MAKRLKFSKLIKLSAKSLLPFSVVTSAIVPLLACNNPVVTQYSSDAILKLAKAQISRVNNDKFQLYKDLKINNSDTTEIDNMFNNKSFSDFDSKLKINLTNILQNLVTPQNDSLHSKWSYPKIDLKIEAINNEKFTKKYFNYKGKVKVILTHEGNNEVIDELVININNDRLDDKTKLNTYLQDSSIITKLTQDTFEIAELPQDGTKTSNPKDYNIIVNNIKKIVQKELPDEDLDVKISEINPTQSSQVIYNFGSTNDDGTTATGEIKNLKLTFGIKGSDEVFTPNSTNSTIDNVLLLNNKQTIKVKQNKQDLTNQITSITEKLTKIFFRFEDYQLPYENTSSENKQPVYLFPDSNKNFSEFIKDKNLISDFEPNNQEPLKFNSNNLQTYFNGKIKKLLNKIYKDLDISFTNFDKATFTTTNNDDIHQEGYFSFDFNILKTGKPPFIKDQKFNVYFKQNKNKKIMFPKINLNLSSENELNFNYIKEIGEEMFGDNYDHNNKFKNLASFDHVTRKIAKELVKLSYNKYTNIQYDKYIIKAIEDEHFSILFIDQANKSLINSAKLLKDMHNKLITIKIVISKNGKNEFFEQAEQKFPGIKVNWPIS